jgi:hypothetical protein
MAMIAQIEYVDTTKPDLIARLVESNAKLVTPMHCVAFLTALKEVHSTPCRERYITPCAIQNRK